MICTLATCFVTLEIISDKLTTKVILPNVNHYYIGIVLLLIIMMWLDFLQRFYLLKSVRRAILFIVLLHLNCMKFIRQCIYQKKALEKLFLQQNYVITQIGYSEFLYANKMYLVFSSTFMYVNGWEENKNLAFVLFKSM